MFLSKDSIEILLDLVEIRLETLQVMDKEDVKELSRLKLCKHELFQKQKYFEENHCRKNTLPFNPRREKNINQENILA